MQELTIEPKLLVYDITDYCELADCVEAVREVYIFDYSRGTNCCSLTPSYDCRFLYNAIIFKDDASEEDKEYWEGELAWAAGEDSYFSVPEVQRAESTVYPSVPSFRTRMGIIDLDDPVTITISDEYTDDDDGREAAYNDAMDELQEYYLCNVYY